ncbi:MAG: type I-A CRISPR-associated protein Cas7/Csa2 [Candidatus Verstraetearchaeota archaeon]|jgi:CRISPR-associated protein Csa2|nr:type I-A CRISPR-associated protein Cas7/Csa2 [Candidatus Verstraetearchaeota archaeon]
MVYVSLAGRVRANIEALNMAETIGNVSRRRRAPYILKVEDGYKLVYVPVISGESIAHAYQANLVEAAKLIYSKEGLTPPVDIWALRNEMIKFSDKEHLTDKLKEVLSKVGKGKLSPKEVEEVQHMFEKVAIQESIVADIGGFLYAEKPISARRTSLFQVGYATPVEDAITEAAIEAQMHARQVAVGLKTEEEKLEEEGEEESKKEEEREAQMLYYVEIASAVYGITMQLDVSNIGVTSMVKREQVVSEQEKNRRIKTALLALAMTMGLQLYGAKRSRFNPFLDIESLVGVVSKPLPLTPLPPQRKDYIDLTVQKVKKVTSLLEKFGINGKASMISYGKVIEGVIVTDTPEEFFEKLIDETFKLL